MNQERILVETKRDKRTERSRKIRTGWNEIFICIGQL